MVVHVIQNFTIFCVIGNVMFCYYWVGTCSIVIFCVTGADKNAVVKPYFDESDVSYEDDVTSEEEDLVVLSKP